MGNCFSDRVHYPKEILFAIEERFLKIHCMENEENYLSLYVFAYEMAFFLRNDPVQSIVERSIEKRTGRLVPSGEDWVAYCMGIIDQYVRQKRWTRFGYRAYPILVGIDWKL